MFKIDKPTKIGLNAKFMAAKQIIIEPNEEMCCIVIGYYPSKQQYLDRKHPIEEKTVIIPKEFVNSNMNTLQNLVKQFLKAHPKFTNIEDDA